MKNSKQLINNVIGQLHGVNSMIGDDKDCLAVLTQLKAAKSGLNSVIIKYIEENSTLCLKHQGRIRNQARLKSLLKELVKSVD